MVRGELTPPTMRGISNETGNNNIISLSLHIQLNCCYGKYIKICGSEIMINFILILLDILHSLSLYLIHYFSIIFDLWFDSGVPDLVLDQSICIAFCSLIIIFYILYYFLYCFLKDAFFLCIRIFSIFLDVYVSDDTKHSKNIKSYEIFFLAVLTESLKNRMI